MKQFIISDTQFYFYGYYDSPVAENTLHIHCTVAFHFRKGNTFKKVTVQNVMIVH
jgi:hypothetical protein